MTSWPHKIKILTAALENAKKWTSKHSTTKTFSRKFKNLSRIFCTEFSEDCFIYNSGHAPLQLTVSADFDNLKASFAVKIDM